MRRPGGSTGPSDTDPLRQGALHGAHGLLLHVRQHVGVGVHRLLYRGVPEHLLDYLGMSALGEQEGGTRMPKVVKPYPGQPGVLE